MKHTTLPSTRNSGLYQKFMRRNKDKLGRGRCRPRDINRYSWCTFEICSMIYKGVYSSMVDAGVTVKLEEDIMNNKFGEIIINKEEMFGRPTKFMITKPE
jgi:hypothetical protein